MASLLSPRRGSAEVALHATTAESPTDDSAQAAPTLPVRWWWAAAAGGLGTALLGWIVCAGLAALGWVADAPGTLGQAIGVGTRLWLLAGGVGVELGRLPVTLIPWGLTALLGFLLARATSVAARFVTPGQPTVPAALATGQPAGPIAVALVALGGHVLPVFAVGVVLGEPWLAPLRWAAVIAVLGLAAWWGAVRVLGRPAGLPGWLVALARSTVAALLVMLAAGAAVLVTGLAVHRDRVAALHAALDPGVTGSIALLAAQLAVVPDVLVWAGSYALGSGFALGPESLVAPAATQLGLLPGLPLLGALPAAGPGSIGQLWWLGSGALAGGIAAWVALLRWPGTAARPLRLDLSSLVGGLAGVVAGLAFTALGWASGGDLGADRLAGLGPQLVPLLVMGCTTMGLSGLITGLLAGLSRRRSR